MHAVLAGMALLMPITSPGCTGTLAWKVLRVAGTRSRGPSWPTTIYLAGSATLRKTFMVSAPTAGAALWLQEVTTSPLAGGSDGTT